MRNAKSANFQEGNCQIMWDRLISKYAPHTALSLLKLKSKFHDSKLVSTEKDPDEWISNLKVLRICMGEFGQIININDENSMIHILNNLPEEYDVNSGSAQKSSYVKQRWCIDNWGHLQKVEPLVQKN